MSKSSSQPRVAFVYDRVNTPYGGAENVLCELHQIFPDAPLFTSVYDPERAPWASTMNVRPSFLQSVPFARQFHRLFAWAMPLAFESFSLDEFEIVISITSAEAKGVLTKPHQLHICYLLTPTRYLWSHTEEYQQHWFSGWFRKKVFAYLRWWDEVAAWRPDVVIPISQLVADRCRQYYKRPTEAVIYPPVALDQFTYIPDGELPTLPPHFFLIVSRLVSYKRVDLAIQACVRAGKNLVIIGEGPDLDRLQNLADQERHFIRSSSQVLFQPSVQPELRSAYYDRCAAFLSPAEEDFGITALEAQAAGKPVLIYYKSGAAEIVQDGVTGIHLKHQSVEEVMQALQKVEQEKWNAEQIRRHVTRYNSQAFQHQFATEVMKLWQQWKGLL